MKLKFFLRPALAIVFAFIGAFIANTLRPGVGDNGLDLVLVVAALAFGTLGFILPEVVEFAGRAGIVALARQIAGYIPTPAESLSVSAIALRAIKHPSFGHARDKYVNPMVVDTSVLVDGRLVDIARAGFLFGTLLILPSVIEELHRLADSADAIKRARARRGLDILSELRAEKKIKVEVLSRDVSGETVDGKLVTAAKKMRAKLLTVDYNLNKVAKVSKVVVLNLNELANAAKTVVLPGETFTIQIIARGAQRQQGVGYLADGTMVVVEESAGKVGEKIDVVVDKVLQTEAGKMVFGRIATRKLTL